MKIFESIINLLYQSAMGKRTIRRWWTPVGAVFFGSLLLLMLMAGAALDRRWGLPELLPSPISLFISVPLLFIGIFLWLWCVILFFRAKGTPVPLNPPPKLIDTGPYAYSRNPMISGVLFMFAAVGIMMRSITISLIITPMLAVIIVIELKMVEEPELEKRLGEPYRQYKKRVPMFFPKPWRRRGQKIRG